MCGGEEKDGDEVGEEVCMGDSLAGREKEEERGAEVVEVAGQTEERMLLRDVMGKMRRRRHY